jgi:hypothetical protein
MKLREVTDSSAKQNFLASLVDGDHDNHSVSSWMRKVMEAFSEREG